MGIPLFLVTQTEKNNIPHVTSSYFHYIYNADTTLTTLSNLHAPALKLAENNGKLSVIHSANTGFRKKITLVININ
jgi:hypothetical protein